MTAFLYVSDIWRLVQLLNKSSQSSKHVLVITNLTSSIGRYINGISVVSNTLLRGVFHNQGSCALDVSFSPHCPQVFNIPTGTIRYCALHARTSRALTRVKLAPLTSVQIATLFSWPIVVRVSLHPKRTQRFWNIFSPSNCEYFCHAKSGKAFWLRHWPSPNALPSTRPPRDLAGLPTEENRSLQVEELWF